MKRNIITAAIFLVFTLVYIANMAPSYNSDDSPETTVAYHTLGIQHPPGYPLATIAGKIFTLLPAGSIAFRTNIMSAVFNMLAGVMIFLLSKGICGGGVQEKMSYAADLAGILAAVFYLFSASAWLQGCTGKGSIYSLNAFLLAVCLWSLFKINKGGKYLYLFSFVYGLSMGNHWTSMAVIAPAVFFYIFLNRRCLTIKNIAISSLLFAAGAGVYIYVVIRNAGLPVYAWGDTKSIKDFIWLISRAQYAGAEANRGIANGVHQFLYYFKNLFTGEYPFFLSLLFIPGAYFLLKKFFKEGVTLIAAYFLIVCSVSWFASPPPNTEWIIKPYMVSSNVFIAVFTACFISYAVSLLKRKYRIYAASAALAACFISLALCNQPGYSRYFIGYDYSANIAKSIPEGSIFFTEGDMNVGSSLHLTLVEKKKFTPLIPVVLMYDWYLDQVKRNFPGGVNLPPAGYNPPDFIASIINSNQDKSIYYSCVFNRGFINPAALTPSGIVFKIDRPGEKRIVSDRLLNIYSFRGLAGDGQKFDEFTQRLVIENYAMAFYNFADILRTSGDPARSIKYYNRGLLFLKNAGAYVNLGLAYYSIGDMDGAQRSWLEALKYTSPDPSVIYANLAFASIKKMDIQKAREYTDKALSINAMNRVAQQLKTTLK
jgi:hypothetical protein